LLRGGSGARWQLQGSSAGLGFQDRQLQGSSAGLGSQDLEKTTKTAKKHLNFTLVRITRVQVGPKHFKTVFYTGMDWFQMVFFAILVPSLGWHCFFTKISRETIRSHTFGPLAGPLKKHGKSWKSNKFHCSAGWLASRKLPPALQIRSQPWKSSKNQ